MGNAATIPHVQARAAALAALGWTGREANWIALVCLQSGVFTRAQWSYFFDDASRVGATRFTRTLLDRGVAVEDDRAIFPGGARAVHITHKPIYRALGIENVKHRRGAKATKTQVLMRRLLALDYVIERPTLGWLPTEDEKVQRFDALGIDRARLPYRVYGEEGKTQKRFFALKFPVAVDAKAATFVYVDPGLTTDSELRAWGTAHAPLWAALRARTFAVQIVAIGADPSGADRAEQVLRRWTTDGDHPPEASAGGPTKADPEVQQEMQELERVLVHGDHRALQAAGGLMAASKRLVVLRQLPDGTPTTETRRGAIDHYSTWSTTRLIHPETAA